MVLLMMQLHDLRTDDRLESVVVVWQIGQRVLGARRNRRMTAVTKKLSSLHNSTPTVQASVPQQSDRLGWPSYAFSRSLCTLSSINCISKGLNKDIS